MGKCNKRRTNIHPFTEQHSTYLLKDYVKFDTFYISLSTKRKRDTDEDDGESKVERVPKKAKIDFDHQFYLWKRNDSNFDRHPPTFTIGIREG
jgi:hypothetical protein